MAHFTAAADSTGLPVILYDIPGRTGTPIRTETLLQLAQHPRIVGVKDAKGDLFAGSQVMLATDLVFYSGDDLLNLPWLSVSAARLRQRDRPRRRGGQHDMIDSYLAGRVGEARQIHRDLLPLCTAIMTRTQGAIATKAALNLLGLPGGPLRGPLANSNNSYQEKNQDKWIWYFLILWTILNAVQAYTLEIHADEAYYWLYSKFLDWGYFDHPPMVAIFIRIGDSIIHSEFGVRMMTVLSSSVSLYVLWRILRQYQVEAKWFILIVPGIFIFNLYGFMTTPDAPLFLFTALFYLVFKKYQEEEKLNGQYCWRSSLPVCFIASIMRCCLLVSPYYLI